jgi:membrane associated rhomboid family serine protease
MAPAADSAQVSRLRMSYPFADESETPPITPAVQWLIAINVAIFFLQLTIVSPADMQGALGFTLGDLGGSWWTVVTYMFVHAGFWHLALNMYTLWIFGRRLEHAWSPGAFTRFYIFCGLGGWLFHLPFAKTSLLLGASAAIFGVMLAYAMRWPDDEVLLFFVIPIKVKWLVVMLGAVNLIQGMGMLVGGARSGPAYLAHLGGLIFGWLYLRTPSAQSLERLQKRVAQIQDIPDEPPRAIPRSLPRPRERGSEVDEVVAKSKAIATKRPASPAAAAPARDPRAEELNAVLDKISEHGLASLSKEERRLLEEMSKRLRDR